MDHGYFEDRVSAYRDKGLPVDEHEMIRRHLEECESCRNLYDRLEKFDRLVRDNAELGDDLYWERAAQKIEQRLGIADTVVTPVAKKSSWSGLGWKITVAAASLVLIVIVGINKDKIFSEKQMMKPSPEMPAKVADSSASQEQTKDFSDAEYKKVVNAPQSTSIDEESGGSGVDEEQPAESVDAGRMRPAPAAVDESTARRQVVASDTRNKTSPATTAEPEDVIQKAGEPSSATSSRPTTSDLGAGERLSVQAESLGASPDQRPVASAPAFSPRALVPQADSYAQADTVDRVRLAELESWRAIKDSLEPTINAPKSKGLFDAMKPTSLASPSRRSAATASSSDQKAALELRYIEACYQIAQLATEPSEVQSARDRLSRVANNPDSPNRDSAQVLLNHLAVRK